MFTTVDNSGNWIAHADGCAHIARDAKRLGASTYVKSHESFEAMADYYGAFDLASDFYEPGTEDYEAEAVAETLSGVRPCKCAQAAMWAAAKAYADVHAGGRVGFIV